MPGRSTTKPPKRRAFRWRMAKSCADCPFNSSGPGLRLRRSLRPGRYRSILAALRRGEYFLCHKTTRTTGNGTNLVCAGSLAYQEKHDVSSNYQRVMEAIASFRRKTHE